MKKILPLIFASIALSTESVETNNQIKQSINQKNELEITALQLRRFVTSKQFTVNAEKTVENSKNYLTYNSDKNIKIQITQDKYGTETHYFMVKCNIQYGN